MIASTIGPYRVLARVGAGGMGEVYRAEDPRLGRHVALKVLTPDLGAEGRQRLLHEARAAAKLNHPAVASIHDVLECDGRLCLVMEFVEGETLVSRLARGPSPPDDLLRLVQQLLEGLVHAHEHGIIHRDLKPANLIITPEGQLKILDFGIARIRQTPGQRNTGTQTQTREISGSPGYAAPEQLFGKAADARSDLYSVGVVMFEALSGQRPFAAADLIGSLMAPMTATPPDISAVNPRVPPEVAEIVSRALRANPGERFGSAGDMLDAVTRARASLAERTTALADAGQARQPVRRARHRVALGVGLLVMLALGVPWLAPVSDWLTPAPAAGRHVIAVLPLEHLGGDGSRMWLGAGISETLGMSLSKIKSVTVISRAEVVEAMRRTRDPDRVARVLGATLMVDGSIQEWQDRLRITVRLVHPNGTVEWSEAYDAPLAGIFALQADLASAVSGQLRIAISPTEREQTSLRLTNSPDALAEYWKGQAALERATLTSNVHAAVESFTRAISLDGTFAAAHAALANAYRIQYGEKRDPALMSRATESAARALSLDPDQPAVRVSLGTIYAGTGRYEAAEIELRHALALQPASDEAHRELANVLLQQNRPDAAIAALRRAIEIRPDYWRNHANLGLAYYRLRRLELARGAFLRAIELQPDNPASHNNMGVVHAQLGDKVRALAEFEHANRLAPTRRGFANLGMYYAEAGRLNDALEAFQRALTYDTRSDVTHGNMADVLTRLGREEDARREYRQARALALELLQVNDKDAAALSRVAVFEAKLGMRDAALAHARAAIELAPRDAEVNYKLAVVQAARRERDDALTSLARAIEYGYSAAMARGDQDLALLRETPEFERLVSQPVSRK